MAQLIVLPDDDALLDAIESAQHRVWIASPFVTTKGVDLITDRVREGIDLRVVTRVHRLDVENGVTHPSALEKLLKHGAELRDAGVRLHAKCWIIDEDVFVGSANLTQRAMNQNIELLVRFPARSPPGESSSRWLHELFTASDEITAETIATMRLWARAARRRIFPTSADGDDDVVLSAPPDSTRAGWIHVGGYHGSREPPDTPIREFAKLQSAATFPKKQFPSGTWRGAPIFFVHSARRRNGEEGWAIIGMGRLRDPVRRVDPEKLAFLKPQLTSDGWDEIKDYPHLAWIINARFFDIAIGDAPFIHDVRMPSGEPLIYKTTTFNRGWYLLDAEQEAVLEAFLLEQLDQHPNTTPDSEDEIWWTWHARAGRFTRPQVDAALGPPVYN